MLHNQSEAERLGRNVIGLLALWTPRNTRTIHPERGSSMVRQFATRAFHFARLHVELIERRACARVPRTYHTIAAS